MNSADLHWAEVSSAGDSRDRGAERAAEKTN